MTELHQYAFQRYMVHRMDLTFTDPKLTDAMRGTIAAKRAAKDAYNYIVNGACSGDSEPWGIRYE